MYKLFRWEGKQDWQKDKAKLRAPRMKMMKMVAESYLKDSNTKITDIIMVWAQREEEEAFNTASDYDDYKRTITATIVHRSWKARKQITVQMKI